MDIAQQRIQEWYTYKEVYRLILSNLELTSLLPTLLVLDCSKNQLTTLPPLFPFFMLFMV